MKKRMSYKERAKLCTNTLAKELFSLMDQKQSNLCVAGSDITDKKTLLEIAETLGPEMILLKTHADIIKDFDFDLVERLTKLSQKLGFLIFEDRKFADIGNTVKQQYEGGLFRIADWAHVTNAHIVPGPGIIQGLKAVGLPKNRGLLLLAEMSSEGNLCDAKYISSCMKMAEAHSDFVIGFITQRRLMEDPRYIHLTPGVHLAEPGDPLGQKYSSPEIIIGHNQSDIMIVGRGINASQNPLKEAKKYREAGWKAFLASI